MDKFCELQYHIFPLVLDAQELTERFTESDFGVLEKNQCLDEEVVYSHLLLQLHRQLVTEVSMPVLSLLVGTIEVVH